MKINEVIAESVTDGTDGKDYPIWSSQDPAVYGSMNPSDVVQNRKRLDVLKKKINPEIIANSFKNGMQVPKVAEILKRKYKLNPNDIDFLVGIGLSMVDDEQPEQPGTQPEPAATATAAPSSTQVAAVQNPATPVATQAGPSTAGAVLKNMSIAETDPLVIAYGKKLFHLNSTGDWAYLGSDAPIKDQTTAALLTKFADSQGV